MLPLLFLVWGFYGATRIQTVENIRQHIHTAPIVLYAGDSDSIWYRKRQSRFVVGHVEETWTTPKSVS